MPLIRIVSEASSPLLCKCLYPEPYISCRVEACQPYEVSEVWCCALVGGSHIECLASISAFGCAAIVVSMLGIHIGQGAPVVNRQYQGPFISLVSQLETH